MNVELVPAVVAGLVGGVVMVLLQVGGRTASRANRFDLLAMWARFLALDGQRMAGLLVHLAVSAAVAVVYALGFGLAGASDAGWAWGLIGSIIHWIVGGVFLGAVPGDSDVRIPEPGPFAMRLGPPAALGFLIGHIAFGLLVGITYFALHPAGGLDTVI